VIGRVAAERDALRQQLADLQGIPVEEIVVTSIGASTGDPLGAARADQSTSAENSGESASPPLISRINYFSVEDVVVARKRRQVFVSGLLLLVLIIGLAAKMGAIQVPADLNRESLTHIPFIGDFLSIFFAGWMFVRVFKIGRKGVTWVFPQEKNRRRRA
jgi:hypothetical protein